MGLESFLFVPRTPPDKQKIFISVTSVPVVNLNNFMRAQQLQDGSMDVVASKEWFTVLEALSEHKGIALLLGATDTGKSTLAKFLVDHLCQRQIKVALVDADIGQSFLGPPTTIGLSFFDSPPDWEGLSSPRIFFVGSTTPEEDLSRHLDGVKKMTDQAVSSGAEVILVDTTGLVSGELGKALKGKKIDLLNPRLLLALQRSDELEPILEVARAKAGSRIFRLPISESARSRSREERRSYRIKKFQEYFRTSEPLELSTNAIALEGKAITADGHTIFQEWALSIKGLLIGLNSGQGETLGLGLIQNDREDIGILTILTPLKSLENVGAIRLSSIRLTPSFEEERI